VDPKRRQTPHVSRVSQGPPAGHASASRSSLFYSQAEAAVDLDMSPGGLGLARQRREVEGLYTTIGRRVLWSRPAIRLCSLGITTPEQIGQLCSGLGIRDLAGLLDFLSGCNGASPARDEET
jgi:hypothetical protein